MEKFYKKYFKWTEVIFFSAVSLVSVCLVYVIPRINKYVIDAVSDIGRPINTVFVILITTAVIFLIHSYMLFFPNFFGSVKGCAIEKRIRSDLISKFLELPQYVYSRFDKSFLLNLFLSDTSNAAGTLINFRVGKIVSFLYFIIAFLVVILVNIELGLIALIFIPFYFIALFLSQKSLYSLSKKQQVKFDTLVNKTNSIISGKLDINNNSCENYFSKAHTSIMSSYFNTRLKKEFLFCLLNRLPKFIEAIAPIIILVVGASLVQKNTMTIGTLVMCMQYVGMMFEPIGNFAQLLTQKTNQSPCFERLSKVLFDNYEIKTLPITHSEIKGLTIKDAVVSNLEKELLFKINSVSFETTGLYCIKGENGSGKTTLLNILCLLYDPECFSLNSKDSILEMSECFLSRSYLHHPHFLFCGTVRENIILGKEFDKEKFQTLTKLFDFESFLDNEIKTNPITLSDGEQQRLALIRSLLVEKATYILDEPEKSLDKETVAKLHKYISTLKENHLVIIVSHTDVFDNIATKILTIANHELNEK